MIKQNGIHFYINIMNYYEVIEDEENTYYEIKKSIHALDTFFTSLELYANELNDINIEKITGSKIHFYIEGNIKNVYDKMFKVIIYAYKLTKAIENDIGKYRGIIRFILNAGAAYGKYYRFVYAKTNEETTIGYACNFAAKLLNKTYKNYLSIDDEIFNDLPSNLKNSFVKCCSNEFIKYGKDCFYSCDIEDMSNLCVSNNEIREELNKAIEFANKKNLSDIDFSDTYEILKFDNISLTKSKKFYGIPMFSDIRNFTKKFKEDDSNLDEMAKLGKETLEFMHDTITNNKGAHIQFQGDREFSVFNDIGDKKCYRNSILAGLRMIDGVKRFNVSIGIGETYGRLFATKFGARGSKDNIVLGKNVNLADCYEDEYAQENQLVISEDIYENIKNDKQLASLFMYDVENCVYYTTKGFNEYKAIYELNELKENKAKNNYNGAWANGF